MKSLTVKGFNEETLSELRGICSSKFEDNPTLYFVLFNIARQIEDAFDNQAMPIEQYKKYEELIPLVLGALKKQDLPSIDDLIKSFNKAARIFP